MPRPRDQRPADPAADRPPRIVGGTLRGRRLTHRPGGPTRPMKDRVRETLFDLLGTAVRGAVVIDLFAGTGALAFEALSRGAARAVLAERHFPTVADLRRTAQDLGVADRCEVRAGDVLTWARRLPELPREAAWLVFISPPWGLFRERPGDVVALVAALLATAPVGSVLVVESDEAFDPALLPSVGSWERRPLPPAVLHIHGRLVS